jgi:eukaryotic-like serine/threonine-protein kinase
MYADRPFGAAASPQIVGRYAIYGKIASGGMASVHFGRLLGAAGFSRTVAVKRLHAHLAEDPQFLSTMIDEARLAARIHHPNVVPTLDVVAANGELLVVMEYVRGESLARLLRTARAGDGRMPLSVASAIAIGALHGLHAAHEATSDRGTPLGIVHRDVSPQNILVGVDGVARVIDFGVAKAAGRLQTTKNGAIKGKVAYMAPEQLAAGDQRYAAGEVTRAADIYAAGAVLWEMLAGRRLFAAENDAQLVLQVLVGAKDPPSRYARKKIPPLLDDLVMRALAIDPADRFASAKAMAEVLLHVAPPAFPTNVGAWVEDTAREALTRRGAELALIESSSETIPVAVPASGSGVPASGRGREDYGSGEPAIAATGDAPTIASQPSSLSVETPKPRPRPLSRVRRVQVASALGGTLLLAAGATTLVWRGTTPPEPAITPVSAAASANDAPALPSAVPPPSVTAEEPARISPSADPPSQAGSERSPPLPAPLFLEIPAASAPASHAPVPSKVRAKPHSSPKPSGPFRFTQPD